MDNKICRSLRTGLELFILSSLSLPLSTLAQSGQTGSEMESPYPQTQEQAPPRPVPGPYESGAAQGAGESGMMRPESMGGPQGGPGMPGMRGSEGMSGPGPMGGTQGAPGMMQRGGMGGPGMMRGMTSGPRGTSGQMGGPPAGPGMMGARQAGPGGMPGAGRMSGPGTMMGGPGMMEEPGRMMMGPQGRAGEMGRPARGPASMAGPGGGMSEPQARPRMMRPGEMAGPRSAPGMMGGPGAGVMGPQGAQEAAPESGMAGAEEESAPAPEATAGPAGTGAPGTMRSMMGRSMMRSMTEPGGMGGPGMMGPGGMGSQAGSPMMMGISSGPSGGPAMAMLDAVGRLGLSEEQRNKLDAIRSELRQRQQDLLNRINAETSEFQNASQRQHRARQNLRDLKGHLMFANMDAANRAEEMLTDEQRESLMSGGGHLMTPQQPPE
jgi:hypothetical protein